MKAQDLEEAQNLYNALTSMNCLLEGDIETAALEIRHRGADGVIKLQNYRGDHILNALLKDSLTHYKDSIEKKLIELGVKI